MKVFLKIFVYILISGIILSFGGCSKYGSANVVSKPSKSDNVTASTAKKSSSNQEVSYPDPAEDERFAFANAAFENASKYYIEIDGLRIRLGAKESDIEAALGMAPQRRSGSVERGENYCQFGFGSSLINFYYSDKTSNTNPLGLAGFLVNTFDFSGTTTASFTDSFGFTIGEHYPNMADDLVRAYGTDVIDYFDGGRGRSYTLSFDINDAPIPTSNDRDPSVYYYISYLFNNLRDPDVLTSINCISNEMYSCVNAYSVEELPEYLFENKVTGTYTGIMPGN